MLSANCGDYGGSETRHILAWHPSICGTLYFLVKILYVSQYFPPEMGAPSARAAELADHWARAGHDVSVLTGFPNHPTGIVPSEWKSRLRHLAYKERIGQVNVFRTWLWPLPNRKAHERIRNYSSFCVSAALRGLTLPRPDVIIATSPQLLVGLSGLFLSSTRGIPFVFEVRDLWPESLTAVGIGSKESILHRTLTGIARLLYDRSERVVVVTPAFKDWLVEHWGIPVEKIAVVENGVETETFSPHAAADQNIREQIGAEGKFVASYIGTMGNAHGLGTLLDAAERLLQDPKFVFLLIGEGAEKDHINDAIRARGLTNVRLLDQQPRNRVPAFILASDVCLVLLKKTDVFKTVIPSKMLEFMSCSRPIILGVDGQARQILCDAEAGLAIEPENSDALVLALKHLAQNPDRASTFGRRGREYILKNFSRAGTAEKYIAILEETVREPAA
jgi:glycosyltransferase involved in cell wall biosynthesis